MNMLLTILQMIGSFSLLTLYCVKKTKNKQFCMYMLQNHGIIHVGLISSVKPTTINEISNIFLKSSLR